MRVVGWPARVQDPRANCGRTVGRPRGAGRPGGREGAEG